MYGWTVAVCPSVFFINTGLLLKKLCVILPRPAMADPIGVVDHDGSHMLADMMAMSAPVSIIPLTFICEGFALGIVTVQTMFGL